jgi:tetratricopeptide (TPR) repeat protein
MSDRDRLRTFWRDWNYVPNDRNEFKKLRVRLDELLEEVWTRYIGPLDHRKKKFSFISGTRFLEYQSRYTEYNSSLISDVLNNDTVKLLHVMEVVQYVLWALEGEERLASICEQLNAILDVSPNIPAHVVYQNGTAKLRPSGARLLDEAVIDSNLEWLAEYPEALKAFEAALRIYMQKDASQYRNMLDSLRVALEQMLKAVLQNDKPIEKQDVRKWITDHDGHPQIANMYNQVLGTFALYENEAVKHNSDAHTRAEVEFTLYLVGTLLRYIQQANEQPATSTTARTSHK